MSASEQRQAAAWRGFKIKNPISKFKEVFKKEVDQQCK